MSSENIKMDDCAIIEPHDTTKQEIIQEMNQEMNQEINQKINREINQENQTGISKSDFLVQENIVLVAEKTEKKEQMENNTNMEKTNCQMNGEKRRPFVTAVAVYKKILDAAVNDAKKYFDDPRNKDKYSKVIIRLFDSIHVVSENYANNNHANDIITYKIHTLHYGPILKSGVYNFPEGTPKGYKDITYFCNRDHSIWRNMEDYDYNSYFVKKQSMLKDEGYYLQDLSYHIYNPITKKFFYKINIRMYKNKKLVIPRTSWHGYSVIPGFNNDHKKNKSNNNNNNEKYLSGDKQREQKKHIEIDHGDFNPRKPVHQKVNF